LESERDGIVVEQENVIAEYYDLKEKIAAYEQDMKDVMNHPNYCLQFIQPGRLVRIKNDNKLYDWGVVANCNKRIKPFVRHLRSYLTNRIRRLSLDLRTVLSWMLQCG
jgi:ATP-dependent RNA helicase DOB1